MKKPWALRGHINLILIVSVLLAAGIGVTTLVLRTSSAEGRRARVDVFALKKGSFDVSIPVSGELAALTQTEIRNKVMGAAVITEVVEEGRFVKAGDVLLRFNDQDISDRLRDSQDRVNLAEAALIKAQSDFDITKKERESELAKADLAIMLADLALSAWQEGEDVSKRQELALALETAEKDHSRLAARFVESEKLLEQKFISLDEFKQDEIRLLEARASLEQAKLDITVYEKYQFAQDKATKESDLEQARSERERVEQQYDAEVRSAESEVDSKKFQLDSAKEKLAELELQLGYCTVTAPSDGLVVYSSSLQSGGMGRNEGRPPMVGTEIRNNEAVMVLPDTSQMVAVVKVSEALSGMIRRGQRASIVSDASPDTTLTGEVISVGVLAESGGWRDPNRRDYSIRIRIKDENTLGLKPSMRCKAEIFVARVTDALYMPVQAIFRNGPLTFVYVPQRGGYAQKQVTLGRTSELYVEVVDSLKEGDLVLLREPATQEIVFRLPAPKREETHEPEAIAEEPAMLPPGVPPSMADMPNGGAGGAGGPSGAPGAGGQDGQGDGAGAPGAPGQGRRGGRGPGGMGGRPDGTNPTGTPPEGTDRPRRQRPAGDETPASSPDRDSPTKDADGEADPKAPADDDGDTQPADDGAPPPAAAPAPGR